MKVLIIIENDILKKWHFNCLRVLKKYSKDIIFCNFKYKKKYDYWKIFYYLLKGFSKASTEKNYFKKIGIDTKIYNFSIYTHSKVIELDKNFEEICKKNNINLIIRFGLGIIRSNLKIPILSFHHGDPSKYRGRPSCFYEIFNLEKTVGQVVQILDSNIDRGKVLAFAEVKTDLGSFKKTLERVYSISPYVLDKAMSQLSKRELVFNKSKIGKLYFNPNNLLVVKFVLKMIQNKIDIIFKKVFYYKKWGIFTIPYKKFKNINNLKEIYKYKKKIFLEKKYNFIADPFYHKKNLIFEITSKFSQKGKLGILRNKNIKVLKNNFKHISFPSVITLNKKKIKKTIIIPEISKFSSPNLYTLKKDKLKLYLKLKIENSPKIIDPILFKKKEAFYLFGNIPKQPEILNLWISYSLDKTFKLHPSSPIKMSPLGSRMAGSIIILNKKMIRVGQNNLDYYGDGLIFYEIKKITKDSYREVFISEFNNSKLHGPHTFSISKLKKEIAIDYYKNKFSLFSLFTKLNS